MLKVFPEESERNERVGGEFVVAGRDRQRRCPADARRRCRPRSPLTSSRSATRSTGRGHRRVVRNGNHAPREVSAAAGAVPAKQPRVNDNRIDEATGERKRLSSAILPAWARKSRR
jgi:hypothetical protein